MPRLLPRRRALPAAALLLLLPILLALTLPACGSNRPVPMTASQAEAERWAVRTLRDLTLEQKVGQLFAVQTRGYFYPESDPEYERLLDLVDRFEIGGFIFSLGEPIPQTVLVNELQERSRLPLLITMDMEWGVGMRLERTTTFPRAMALGATGDPDLAYAMGRAVAREARAVGVHQNYAPVADINNNPLNPVINVRSFGEDPDLVSRLAVAYARGLQDGGLIATVKHFPGHGDTDVDSHIDLPVLPFRRARLDSLELRPFRAVLDAGVQSVMVAHLALPEIEPDSTVPATLSPRVVQDILRDDLGFDGLVVTDALVMEGITKYFGSGETCVRALEAGVDQLLMPEDVEVAREAVLEAVASGRLTEERIDRSVLRILRAKAGLNLHRRRTVPVEEVKHHVGIPAHVALRNTIAQRSLTLLRNKDDLLPLLDPLGKVLVVTLNDGADPDAGDFFLQALRTRGRAERFDHALLDTRSDEDDYRAVVEKAAGYDLVVVPTFLRVRSWSGRIALPDDQRAFLDALGRQGPPVALISFGNPYLIQGLEPPAVYLAAFGGSEGTQEAVAEALFGQVDVSGRLPIDIPGVYAIGDGLDLAQAALRRATPEEVGMDSDALDRLDAFLRDAIRDRAFPGAALAVGHAGGLVRMQGYGYYAYESEKPVTPRSVFDLASLTKVVATTTAVMLLHDEGRIDLDAPLATYLPEFGQNGKAGVTIRHILTHTSGLTSHHPFYQMGVLDRQALLEAIFRDPLRTPPGTAYAYSDLGMIALAVAVENVTGQKFEQFCEERIFRPLGMRHTGFRPASGQADPSVVPTEFDQTFRKRLIQGEVHDENAWILGGVAGHAGLFSTAEDLARFAQMLLNGGVYNGRRLIREQTVRMFTTRVPSKLDHTRALGWDTQDLRGEYSSAGALFGARSFGHTGFTGTSMWMDPDAQLFVVLLTNRVYPTRRNGKIRDVRPAVADLAYGALTGRPSQPARAAK